MAPPAEPPADLANAAAASPSAVLTLVLERGGSPLRDGTTATFVFLGTADGIRLRHWMDIFPPIRPFARIGETDTWWTSLDLPDSARVEYKLEVQRPGRKRLIIDPLNPRRAEGPFGTNSVAAGPGYRPTPYSRNAPRGRLVDLPVVSAVFGETRTCRLYLPHGYSGEPVPLLVAHDGSEYLHYAALGTVLDAVNATKPVAALLVDPDDRLVEYGADPRHAAHLVEEAIPAARTRITATGLIGLGASFGAIATLHAARHYRGTFKALVLQSGSFVEAQGGPFRRGKRFAPVIDFMHRIWADPGELPGRMHLSCGQFDGLIGDNRRTVERLRGLGVEVGWAEAPDGHHWALWQDLMGAGLRFALASPNTGEEAALG